ncbi:MAG: peptidylprolyl isomerase [Elusimicrobia bacterium]|nr:peptidylprolyl isomerase [Elusimicrobiota bacterium]
MNKKAIIGFVAAIALMSAVSCKPEDVQDSAPIKETQTQGKIMETAKSNTDALSNPALANEKAPEVFKVKFRTSKGEFVIESHREWSPLGADRFYNLAKIGYFTDIAFFRVISGFMAQFGIHGDPAISANWRIAQIKDDPVIRSNKKGYISFAMAGTNTRTTQLFINYGNNANLDSMGFSPFGKVIEGMDVVDSIYSGYGEGAPSGRGPSQHLIQSRGNEYLKKDFSQLDYIIEAIIE